MVWLDLACGNSLDDGNCDRTLSLVCVYDAFESTFLYRLILCLLILLLIITLNKFVKTNTAVFRCLSESDVSKT